MSGVQAIYLLLELNLPLQQHQYPLQEQKMMPMGLIVEKLLALSDAVPVEGAHSASQLVEKQLVVQPAPLLLATGQFSNTNIRRQATKPIILSNIYGSPHFPLISDGKVEKILERRPDYTETCQTYNVNMGMAKSKYRQSEVRNEGKQSCLYAFARARNLIRSILETKFNEK